MERAAALLAWYRDRGRDLPWRRTRDPWPILVSEVMLQQTQVDRVIPRFTAFLSRFPTPHDAATAPLATVLEAWSGLGYNARARRLQETARLVSRDGWPPDAAGLRRLPGIGPYTAAAIASIAFGEQVAVVDTNVRRVLSRWHGEPLHGRVLADAATDALSGDAATWNQAVMDLGAAVCRPRPDCAACPVTAWCRDPTVYVPPPRQSRFEGSDRQVGGAVLKTLIGRDWTATADLATATGHDASRVEHAAARLLAARLIEARGGRVRLPRS